jgi:hypothetical protein
VFAGVVDFNPGGLQYLKGFGAAVAGYHRISTGVDYILRRLDTGTLGGIHVLGIFQDGGGVGFGVDQNKLLCASETLIQV